MTAPMTATEAEIADLREQREKIEAAAKNVDAMISTLETLSTDLGEWLYDIEMRIAKLEGDPNEGLFDYLTRFINAHPIAGFDA